MATKKAVKKANGKAKAGRGSGRKGTPHAQLTNALEKLTTALQRLRAPRFATAEICQWLDAAQVSITEAGLYVRDELPADWTWAKRQAPLTPEQLEKMKLRADKLAQRIAAAEQQ